MHGIDFLYNNLGRELAKEYDLAESPDDAFCDCCKRPRSDWLERDSCVIGSYSGRQEVHCLSCQSLYHGSFDLLGQEGYRQGKPTAIKIGMLKGCGLLLTENGSVLYAPGKYYQKFLSAPKSIFDEVVDLGGRAIVLDALGRKAKPPFLLIENFGVKKADLVKHLRVTANESVVYVCSESGVYDLPVSYLSFSSAVDSLGKGEKIGFLSLLKKQSSRYLSTDEHKEFARIILSNKNLENAMKEAPSDPHLRFKFASLSEVS